MWPFLAAYFLVAAWHGARTIISPDGYAVLMVWPPMVAHITAAHASFAMPVHPFSVVVYFVVYFVVSWLGCTLGARGRLKSDGSVVATRAQEP